MPWNKEIGKKSLDEQVNQIFCELVNGFTKQTLVFDIGGCADKGLYTFVSKAAYEKISVDEKLRKCLTDEGIKYCSQLTKQLTIEHCVPTDYVYQELKKEKTITKRKVKKVLETLKIAVITKEENKRLNEMFKSIMPNGWKWDDNILARYENLEQKIEIINLEFK